MAVEILKEYLKLTAKASREYLKMQELKNYKKIKEERGVYKDSP